MYMGKHLLFILVFADIQKIHAVVDTITKQLIREAGQVTERLIEAYPCDSCNVQLCYRQCYKMTRWAEKAKEKLAEYETAEEEGRLLFLPCNPGITLYILRKKYTKCSKHNEEFDESSCCGCEDECDSRLFYYIVPCPDATAEQILEYERRGALNKTVFFNVEKAEKKLEELNGV